MTAICEYPVAMMAKKAADDWTTVKIPRALYRDLKTVASFHGDDAGPWLARLIAPIIASELDKVGDAIQARTKAERQRRQP